MVVERDYPVQEIGVSTLGIQVSIGIDISCTGSHFMAVATEDLSSGLPRRGSEFVNSSKVDSARKVHNVVTTTHDFGLDGGIG